MSDGISVELRSHDGYANPIDGGYAGYQACCWDCDWMGTMFLRGDEPMGTDASRAHKQNAKREAWEHSVANQIECCSRCKRVLNDGLDCSRTATEVASDGQG